LTPPRTGVEIVATEERDGVRYHTMRDLRNGSTVKNVTRASARKLWHYAISAKEADELDPREITWQGDIGLWRKNLKSGAVRFDLVQWQDGALRVYYGVTEDGIHGAWRRLIEVDERPAAASASTSEEPLLLPAPSPVSEAEGAVETATPLLEAPTFALDEPRDGALESDPIAGPEPSPPPVRARRTRVATTRKTATKKTSAKKTRAPAAKKTTEAAPGRRRKLNEDAG
jgi:hypothetical protein